MFSFRFWIAPFAIFGQLWFGLDLPVGLAALVLMKGMRRDGDPEEKERRVVK